MTINNPLTRLIVSSDAIEVLCSGGSAVSGSSAVFSGSAGVVGVTQNVIEVLAWNPASAYVSSFAIEVLVNLGGVAETNPVPGTVSSTSYAYVT